MSPCFRVVEEEYDNKAGKMRKEKVVLEATKPRDDTNTER